MKKLTLLLTMVAMTSSLLFSQAFYTQDFASGIPSGWTNTCIDKSSAAHPGSWKYTTRGSKGAYSSGSIINSTTKANGFVIFDSDSLDNGGVANGVGPAPAAQQATLATTPISCSGHNRVLLQFQHAYQIFGGGLYVYVSNGTAIDTFFISRKYEYTFAQTLVDTVRLDVSNVAANQAAVTVTFNWQSANYYYWMIDDISLLDAPANDLNLTDAASYNYSIYPLSQLDTITFQASVSNRGANTQPNTKLITSVKKSSTGSIVFTDTTAAGFNIVSGVDSIMPGINSFVPASGIGSYAVTLSAQSDSVDGYANDNKSINSFQVLDSVYAIDFNYPGFTATASGGAFAITDNTPPTTTTGDVYVNLLFKVVTADTVTSITTSFAGGTGLTDTGSIVQATIYSIDPNAALPTTFSGYTPVVSTENRVLHKADLGTFATMKPMRLRIDPSTGNSILQPGLYAVGVTAAANNSGNIYLHQAQGKVAGSLSGQVTGGVGQVAYYRNLYNFIRINFGHGANLLTCDFTRTPTSTVKANQQVKYTASNSAGSSASGIYSWVITDSTGAQVNGVADTTSPFYFKFPYQGTFNVCLTTTIGNNTAKTCKTIVIKGILGGVEDINFSSISLVPNPTTGRVSISAENVHGAYEVSVLNILGAQVARVSDEANGTLNKTIDLSYLASGTYIVRLQNGENTLTKRLTISK